MLVKEAVYILYLLIFVFSIFIIICSFKNKNKIVSKYIILLSIVYILYLIFNLSLPYIFDLDYSFEILFFNVISCISAFLFVISIIVSALKLKKLKVVGKSLKYIISFVILILLPLLIIGFPYFREANYINNSKLILICSEGSEFAEVDYAYAISDNYTKKISIGADFRGIKMEKHLSKDFHKLNYTWITDKVEINKDKIKITRNDETIYEIKLTNDISYCDVREVFYKQ